MRAIIQRVTHGKVTIDDSIYSGINRGYVILLGIFSTDDEKDMHKIIPKLLNLRIMADKEDKMNLSILDVKGEILVVSQFTLCADIQKGRRPSFINAKNPTEANKLYEQFVLELKKSGLLVKTGVFGAKMNVEIQNDGPVTILLDSHELT
jgi:D-tyrosyl-tRNA(Tyr) deacylase